MIVNDPAVVAALEAGERMSCSEECKRRPACGREGLSCAGRPVEPINVREGRHGRA